MNDNLPSYTTPQAKQQLLSCGASGTVYSLVMPESEDNQSFIMDGCDRETTPMHNHATKREEFLSMYQEPWTQKQDAMHEAYFDAWVKFSEPVLTMGSFPHQYPTAGASEGIFKLMSEYVSQQYAKGNKPHIHMFEGDYEGYSAFANSLGIEITKHRIDDWRLVSGRMVAEDQFWISTPSAIDGKVWEHWDDFILLMLNEAPLTQIIPDLTYIGSVSENYNIDVSSTNITAFVMSQSKPMGGYYHRVGGVFSRNPCLSLFGNKWFKNLQSLAWGTRMLSEYKVHDLPNKYSPIQEEATRYVSDRLGIDLKPSPVMLLATGNPQQATTELLKSLVRGTGETSIIRLCVSPRMDYLIKGNK